MPKLDPTGQAWLPIGKMSQSGVAGKGRISRQAGSGRGGRGAAHEVDRRWPRSGWFAAAPAELYRLRPARPAGVRPGGAERCRRRSRWFERSAATARLWRFLCDVGLRREERSAAAEPPNPASGKARRRGRRPEQVPEKTARTGWTGFAGKNSDWHLWYPGMDRRGKKSFSQLLPESAPTQPWRSGTRYRRLTQGIRP